MEGALLAQINSHTSASDLFSHGHGVLLVLLVLSIAEVAVQLVRGVLSRGFDGGCLLATASSLHRLLLTELETKLVWRLRGLRHREGVGNIPHRHRSCTQIASSTQANRLFVPGLFF